jgi:hypothetical protein
MFLARIAKWKQRDWAPGSWAPTAGAAGLQVALPAQLVEVLVDVGGRWDLGGG